MLSHLTLGTNDPARARAFYDPTLAELGLDCVDGGDVYFAYGASAESGFRLWIAPPFDRLPATWGNGTHLALLARDQAAVDAFHAAALAHGGYDEGAPGPREHYAPDYYGAYVRDPDGNKLQAVCFGDGRSTVPGEAAVSHVTLGINDVARAREFYGPVLATLDFECLREHDRGARYGRQAIDLPWLSTVRPFDGRPASWGNGTHVAFLAPSRAAVDAFHATATALGGMDEGAPGLRPQYKEHYYGAYVRDLDGNKLQAVCYAPE